jgi:hypothetical protein
MVTTYIYIENIPWPIACSSNYTSDAQSTLDYTLVTLPNFKTLKISKIICLKSNLTALKQESMIPAMTVFCLFKTMSNGIES